MLIFFFLFLVAIACCSLWRYQLFLWMIWIIWLCIIFTKTKLYYISLLFGLALAYVSVLYYDHSQGEFAIKDRRDVVFDAEVIAYGKQWQLIIQAETGKRIVDADKHYMLWDRIYMEWIIRALASMDRDSRIQLSKAQFNYKKWLWMKWYRGHLTSKIIISKPTWNSWSHLLYDIQNIITERLARRYTWDYLGIAEWMLLGSKHHINSELYEQFIDSWLVHILVASGGNLAFVLIIFSFLLFRIPFYMRLFVLWIIWCAYTAICWWDSSILRAYIMVLFLFCSYVFWRKVTAWRALMIIIIIVLCRNPYFLLYDLWFRLSVAAIIGIIVAGKFCDRLYYDYGVGWWKFRILQYGILGFCIRLSLLPFLIIQSGKVSVSSLFVNYIVQCLLPFVVYGLSVSLLLWWEIWLTVAHRVAICIDGILVISDRASSNQIILSGNIIWKCLLSIFVYCVLYYFYFFGSDCV